MIDAHRDGLSGSMLRADADRVKTPSGFRDPDALWK